MNKELIGYDENGQVFDMGKYIKRIIKDDYKIKIKEIYQAYKIGELNTKGIVETTLTEDGNLEHKKLVISYPYEWPPSMFKKAIILHLKLFSDIKTSNLVLKDALPNNIVFEDTAPVFIDFLSLVFNENLKNEKWLNPENYLDPRFSIIDKMLIPYIILPFLFIFREDYKVAKEILSIRSCNTTGIPPTWREFFSPKILKISKYRRKYFKSYQIALKIIWLRRSLINKHNGFDKFINKLTLLIKEIDITPNKSAYSSYYDEKKEANSMAEISNFKPKQKTVYDILKSKKAKSVLDIGSNTGWYSVISNRMGAKVISLEQDLSCSDIVFKKAERDGLNILPLMVSFKDLTKEIYGISSSNPIYNSKDFKKIPLYRPGIERFHSELVLVLGLSHHLLLGEGYSIEKMFEILSQLTQKTLVLEYIDLNDEKIVTEPEFFKNISKYDATSYSLDKFLNAGKEYFQSVFIHESNPATRKLLVFDK